MIYTYPNLGGNISVIALKIEEAIRLPDGMTSNEKSIDIAFKVDLSKDENITLDSIMAEQDAGDIPVKGTTTFYIEDVLDNRGLFKEALGIGCEIYPATAPDSRTFIVFDEVLTEQQKEKLRATFAASLKEQ